MISALRQQGGPSHLWNGARRSYLSETWSTPQRGPAAGKSGQIPVGSTVASPSLSAVDLHQRTLFPF